MILFGDARKIQKVFAELLGADLKAHGDIKHLNDRIAILKDELETLKLTKKLELKEIEHLVKMKEEKLGIEHEKRQLSLEQSYNTKEMGLQRTYHDKVLTVINKEHNDIKAVYQEIMKRLPDVNVSINKEITSKER